MSNRQLIDTENYNEKRRIKLVNYIILISIISDIIIISFYSLIGFRELKTPIIILIIFLAIFPIGLLLNHSGKHQAAKIFIILTNTTLTSFFCIYFLGPEAGIHAFLLIFGLIPLFIWPYEKTKLIAFFFLLNLFLYIAIEFLPLPFFNKASIPSEFAPLTRGVAVLISFLGATAAIIGFHRLAHKNELQLQKQNQELRHEHIIRGKVYSIICHDLRSPISSMKVLLKILHNDYKTLSPKETEEFIGSLYHTSESTYTLLENLLDWARMQSGQINTSIENIDLNDLLAKTLDLYQKNYQNKEIKLTIVIEENTHVLADSHMLATIMRNLISNAIKFTHRGGDIKIICKNINNKQIEIAVTDNGIGIQSNQLENIFNIEKGYMRTGTDNEKGSGLGLIICRDYIKKIGGQLQIQSKPGVGSEFSFCLKKT
jgi:signal transduction histidine kinase